MKSTLQTKRGITLIALILTIIVLVILAGVAINTLYGKNGIITTSQDVAILSNIKSLEEGIELYKIDKNIEGKIEEESYPISLNEDGSRITLSQMKSASELAKLPNEVKYTLLNLTTEKGTTNIPSLDKIDYSKFYKLDYTKLNISEEEAENLVIYVDGDTYKVINLAGVKYQNKDIYVIIPLNNEAEPEYITVANNTYKLYGDGTLKVLGEKTTNSGYTSSEVNAINNSWDEFDLKAINARFDNRMSLQDELTSDWYASHVYFSTGTAYVIDQNNDLWAWGANDYNKLGLGHSFLVVEPTKILEGRCEETKVSKVWAGATNTFVVGIDGNLYGCGTNSNGELGIGKNKITDKYEKINLSSILTNGNDIENIILSRTTKFSTTIIKFNNGKVYACGMNNNYQLGNGNNSNIYTLTEQTQLNNCKNIIEAGTNTLFIDNTDSLYICGSLQAYKYPQKISENIKEAEIKDYITIITNDGKILKNSSIIDNNFNNFSNLENDVNATFISHNLILSNGKIYEVPNSKNSNNASIKYEQIISDKKIRYNGYISVFNNKNKIYIQSQPDITKIKEKSNYKLKKVFENVSFVNGNGNNISIVDREGNVYENTNKDSARNNVKKIISSKNQKFIISSNGHIFAKGSGYGAMWGDINYKNDYIELIDSNGKAFENVKNMFTSSYGRSMIFLTEDNELYFGGNVKYISLPGIKGDLKLDEGTYTTKYPKIVSSVVLDDIKDKIKDIQYFHDTANSQNLYNCNMLILTEDGKLYTLSMNKVTSGNETSYARNTGDFTELTIKEGTTVKQVLTEDGLSLALLSNGEVYGWGYNTYGILGQNYEVGGIYPTPEKLEGLPANIRYMSLGNGFAIFASKSGEVYGIGKNDYGQLGTGDSIGRTEFVRCTKLEE